MHIFLFVLFLPLSLWCFSSHDRHGAKSRRKSVGFVSVCAIGCFCNFYIHFFQCDPRITCCTFVLLWFSSQNSFLLVFFCFYWVFMWLSFSLNLKTEIKWPNKDTGRDKFWLWFHDFLLFFLPSYVPMFSLIPSQIHDKNFSFIILVTYTICNVYKYNLLSPFNFACMLHTVSKLTTWYYLTKLGRFILRKANSPSQKSFITWSSWSQLSGRAWHLTRQDCRAWFGCMWYIFKNSSKVIPWLFLSESLPLSSAAW